LVLPLRNRKTVQQLELQLHSRNQPQVLQTYIRSHRCVVLTTIHELACDIRSHHPLQLHSRKNFQPLVLPLGSHSRHSATIGQLGPLQLLRCTSLQNYKVALWQPF